MKTQIRTDSPDSGSFGASFIAPEKSHFLAVKLWDASKEFGIRSFRRQVFTETQNHGNCVSALLQILDLGSIRNVEVELVVFQRLAFLHAIHPDHDLEPIDRPLDGDRRGIFVSA